MKEDKRKRIFTNYLQLCEDMERKNMRMQVELEQLRTTIYGLQMVCSQRCFELMNQLMKFIKELQRSRMLLSQRDDFCSSLGRQALNNSWLTTQSKRHAQQQYQPLQVASPCQHTFASMLSNTATPSSTNNDIKVGGGLMGQFNPTMPTIPQSHASATRLDVGGSGEGLAEVSLSSLAAGGGIPNRQELGDLDHLISALNVHQSTPQQSAAYKSINSHEQRDKLLTVRTAIDCDNGSDEVKNFRRQHQDSFSQDSSSRPSKHLGEPPLLLSISSFSNEIRFGNIIPRECTQGRFKCAADLSLV